jgi:type IV pilus assembly protein PilC
MKAALLEKKAKNGKKTRNGRNGRGTMPSYEYKARDIRGKIINGVMEAESKEILIDRMRGMGYYVAKISERKKTALNFQLNDLLGKFERIRTKDLIVFNQQLATMISAGVPLITSLDALIEQTESKKLKVVIEQIRGDVEGGSSFSNALARHPNVFSHLFISMVRAGEAGGMLEKVLDRLASFAEEEAEFRANLRGALTYPVILTVVMLGVIGFLVAFVIPRFVGMFEDMGGTLPLPTRMLMGTSRIFQSYWYLILGAVVGGIYWFRYWIKTESGRLKFDQLLLRLPIVSNLTRKVIVSRFSRTLAALDSSGVPILESLEIVEQTIGNKVMAQAMSRVRSSVREGGTIAEPLRADKVFPTMVTQMVSIGEDTGSLDKMLNKISDFFDREVAHTVKALTISLEPIMLALMAGVVVLIALSVLLPMYDMMGMVK